MMQRKKTSFLWLAGGLLFTLLVVLTVFSGLTGTAIIADKESIPETVASVLHCMHDGDLENLEALIWGNPTLMPKTGELNSPEQIIWDAYLQSLQWNCEDPFSIQGAYVTQDIRISCLDISDVTQTMAEILLDTPADHPSEERSHLLSAAAQTVLNNAPLQQSHEITLTLCRDHGQWKVVPDKQFLDLLSGFTTD